MASLGAARWALRKDAQLSGGLSRVGWGGLCRVEDFAEWVGCSFLPARSGVEAAAGVPEVVWYLLWYRLRPRLRRGGCCAGGWGLWGREVETRVVEVRGEKDVAGRHVQAAPTVA